MTVTKQAYSVGAPWLNFQLADQFRQAFIDAGLMTEWHDSFVTGSGVGGELEEHRVLRIVYDASKKYGTVFHWFVFRPIGRISYAYVHQWDANANQPLGLLRKERLTTSYGEITSFHGTGSHRIFATQVLSTTTTLTRYSSSLRPKFAMFLLKGGNNFQCFFLMPPNTQFQPYIDLDLNTCGGLVAPVIQTKSGNSNLNLSSQSQCIVDFCHFFHYQDNIFAYGFSARVNTDSQIAYSYVPGVTYSLFGAGTTDSFAEPTAAGGFGEYNKISNLRSTPPNVTGIALPCELAVDNPDRNTDSTPVFSDIPYSLYIVDRLPLDFGIVGHFSNSTMEIQDIFQVTPGLEEWEILATTNLTNIRNPSALVVARVI